MATIDYPGGVVYAIDTTVAAGDEITTPSVDVTPADNNHAATLTNNGTIRVGSATAAESFGIMLGSPYLFHAGLVNNGLISSIGASSFSKEVYGVITHGAAPVINNGTIQSHVLGAGRAIGIYSYYHGGTMTNAGRIEVTSDQGEAFGIWNAGLNESITNSGQLIVRGGLSPWGDPIGVIGIRSGQSSGVTIDNSGTIDVRATSPNQQTVGIELFPDSTNIHSFGTILNSGTIVAQLAIAALDGYSTSLHVTNSGHIEGALEFESGDNIVTNTAGASWIGTLTTGFFADVVVNAGSITGDILFGKGDDWFDGRGGTVSGTVNGGEGFDFLRGGDAADRLDGGSDRDLLIGGGGADRLTGGAGADVFGYLSFADSAAAARDTITDFQSGADTIDLRALGDVAVSISSAGGVSTVTAQGAGGTLVIDVTGAVAAGDILTGNPGHGATGTDGADIVWSPAGGTLGGLAGDDMIVGSAGDDVLDGGTGADTMEGGAGNDIYYVDNDGDRPVELDGGGFDEVRSTVDFSLQRYIENGSLLGDQAIGMRGNALDNVLTGNAGDNLLLGVDGNDVLIGGKGADHLDGGNGIDWASYEDSATAVSVTLGQMGHGGSAEGDVLVGIENLRGGAGGDTLTGDDGANVLDGGAGADRLTGGGGDDIVYVDRQDDLVFENANGGTDAVISTESYYLYANIERLTLASGAGNIFGVGNDLDNLIQGNEGANLILGGAGNDEVHGGAGNDQLYGQDGHDTLVGDAGVDYLIGGAGNDILAGGNDEDALYGEAGDDVLFGGDDFRTDILTGGDGNDTLCGDSGLGDYDLMDGGAGNDIYIVDTYADVTYEAVGGGTDTVYASTVAGSGYYLYANVENLILLGNTFYGVGNELDNHLTGNDLDNWLLGGAGNDILNGKGGNDVLFGQDGADTFVFEAHTGADTIADFTSGTDHIDLSAFGFTSFAQVQAAMVENGGSSAIVLGDGDLIVLQNVTNAQLHAGDFILSAASTVQVAQPAHGESGGAGALVHAWDAPRLAIDIGTMHHVV